jgi:aryl-alcohol dehydrogenase-like predicted oxidoreductase
VKYRQLGKSGIEVSRLCVGCLSFGKPSGDFHEWTLDPSETETIVSKALDLGITFFDTANAYSHGTSEEYLGRAIKKSVSRDKVVIATKVYFNEGHLSKEAIRREIDSSLKRLDTDYVDLYIIHRFDRTTPIEETMEALDGLVKAGKVRALGASAMYGYQFYSMQAAAERNNWRPFCSMQNHYNLLYREDEREIIPFCLQENVALTPFSPLAAGRLSRLEWKTDTLRSQTDRTAVAKYDGTQEKDSMIVQRVHETAEKYGASMTQIAIAWHIAKGMTAPIIGATKAKHLDNAAGALDISLSAEDIAYLEELYQPHKVVGLLTDDERR